MYVTPGPNNSILAASGIKFGFLRTIPNIIGIPVGHGIQLTLVTLGLGSIFESVSYTHLTLPTILLV